MCAFLLHYLNIKFICAYLIQAFSSSIVIGLLAAVSILLVQFGYE